MSVTFFYDTAGSVVAHQIAAPVFAVQSFERGFYPVFTRLTAAELNAKRAPSADVLESALAASMFGWNAPIARKAREFVEAYERRPMTKAHALALLTLWSEAPALVNGAERDALLAFCQALDANGDFEPLSLAELRAVALEWAADGYHVNHRG